MIKKKYLLGVLIVSALTLTSCASTIPFETGINSQTQRVDSKLKRSDYTLLDTPIEASVANKKNFKKYSVSQLKDAAFMEAEKKAIKSGADGVLNPVYMVDQKGRKLFVTARVKAYKLKSDNEFLDMENNLKHNPRN